MTLQFSTTYRNALLDQFETTVGTSAKLRLLTGSQPAACSTSESGTLLASGTLPSDWMSAASSGSKAKAGTWTLTTAATGLIGYFRITDNAGSTCHTQGSVSQAFALVTSSSTAAASNVLTFSSTTGVAVGMAITGTGVPSGATVLAVSSTTVTMSAASTGGVSSGVTIYFGDTSGDMYVSSTTVTSVGISLTVSTFTLTAPGA
jgi:hypothetical protein